MAHGLDTFACKDKHTKANSLWNEDSDNENTKGTDRDYVGDWWARKIQELGEQKCELGEQNLNWAITALFAVSGRFYRAFARVFFLSLVLVSWSLGFFHKSGSPWGSVLLDAKVFFSSNPLFLFSFEDPLFWVPLVYRWEWTWVLVRGVLLPFSGRSFATAPFAFGVYLSIPNLQRWSRLWGVLSIVLFFCGSEFTGLPQGFPILPFFVSAWPPF